MKITFLIARADTVGGAQVHVRDLAISLQQDGHQVTVITGKKGVYNEILKEKKVESIAIASLQPQINPIQDFQSLNLIIKTIKKIQPDLVSTHSSKTGILGRIACNILNVPCIFTAHGWSFTSGVPEPSRTIYQNIEKLTAPLARKIICVSDCDRSIALDVGMNSDRLITVHNGMKDIPVANQNQKQKPVKVLMVARFGRQKDHETIIRAFRDISDAELILVGDGSGFAEMESLVQQLNLAHKVKLLGFRKDVPEIMAQAQIYALISHWEGLPRTIIEAMRGGLPVVASDVGGVKELVTDGETGYIIPRQDRELLTQRINDLVQDEQLRLKMGQAGRKKYESQFTFEQMYHKTLATYKQAITHH